MAILQLQIKAAGPAKSRESDNEAIESREAISRLRKPTRSAIERIEKGNFAMDVYSYRHCRIEIKMFGRNQWAYLIKRDESWLYEVTPSDLYTSMEESLQRAKAQIDKFRDL